MSFRIKSSKYGEIYTYSRIVGDITLYWKWQFPLDYGISHVVLY